jgi:hypothetical protein
MSQLDDIDEAHVPLATLDAAHIVAMEIRQLCKLLLREPPLHTKLTQANPEQLAWVRCGHSAMIGA